MIKQISEDSILTIFNALATSEQDYKNKLENLKNENISLSVINCMNGLLLYLKGEFSTSLSYFRDAEILLKEGHSPVEDILYNFILGFVNFCEKNNNLYMLHYNKAMSTAESNNFEQYITKLEDTIKLIKNGSLYVSSVKNDPLLALVKIGQAVAAEKDIDKLMQTIAEEARDAVQADRCTVFLYDEQTDELWSKVALGLGSQELRFNASQGLAGHVFRTGETINIKDAYSDDRFNKAIDAKTGYTTKTILCMPIRNIQQKIIGAFQILNKLSGYFTPEDEDILVAIGSSAGISLENAKLFARQNELLEEQKIVFDSFISTLAASIDARDKITAGHSTRVRMYSSLIAEQFDLSKEEMEIIQKAAALHDIGKIGIRDSVLQKEGKLTPEEYKHIQEHVEITHNILEKIHMSDDFKMITEIACSHHEKYDGSGYYRHLKGEEIPFGGRILAVADVFDAITSKRHYRDKMPIQKVIAILIGDSGTHFDKSIVDKFLSIPLDKVVQVFLTENHLVLSSEDSCLLAQYNLKCLYDSINSELNKELVAKFNMYYTGIEADE
ncbi:MAG: GAF domain-containing protein [Candidatus Gastranaerophilales bacterium]|nr:GAF domain-containing protein [Candidatus Gastranaerophilales bacterium]